MTEETRVRTFEERWAVRKAEIDREALRFGELRREAWKDKRLVVRQVGHHVWHVTSALAFGYLLVPPALAFWSTLIWYDFGFSSWLLDVTAIETATPELAKVVAGNLTLSWAFVGGAASLIYAMINTAKNSPMAHWVNARFESEQMAQG